MKTDANLRTRRWRWEDVNEIADVSKANGNPLRFEDLVCDLSDGLVDCYVADHYGAVIGFLVYAETDDGIAMIDLQVCPDGRDLNAAARLLYHAIDRLTPDRPKAWVAVDSQRVRDNDWFRDRGFRATRFDRRTNRVLLAYTLGGE